ncbi:DUF5309 family protein [Solibacillus sp. FSL R7-0668]|uniref:SU10 major capsid protein n=1 Tax=Solibacillus sp. FSL R7-0668 TaxID=2921688 RepID=UPI0030F4E9E9
MIKSSTFLETEQLSLSNELVVLGIQATPLTSLLLSKGSVEKAMSTVYTWREKTIDNTDDITFAEGSETTVFQESVKRELNNILQIFKKAVSISGTAEAMQRNKFTEEVSDRLLELKINLEKTLINGLKDDGSTTGIRKMSGIIEMADAANAVTASNGVDALLQGMRKMWDNDLSEGQYYAFVNADIKEEIDTHFQSSYSYQHKTTNFGLLVETINTNYGQVNLVLSKHVPADKIVLFNDKYVDMVTLREAQFEALAKTGDSTKGHIVGEYSLKVASPKGVAILTV